MCNHMLRGQLNLLIKRAREACGLDEGGGDKYHVKWYAFDDLLRMVVCDMRGMFGVCVYCNSKISKAINGMAEIKRHMYFGLPAADLNIDVVTQRIDALYTSIKDVLDFHERTELGISEER